MTDGAGESRREKLRQRRTDEARRASVKKVLNGKQAPRPLQTESKQTSSAKKAGLFLDAYLQQAHENVANAIKDGNLSVSQWLIDKVAKDTGTVIPESAVDGLDVSDPTKTAEKIVNAVLHGRLSIEAASKLLDLVAKQASMTGQEQIAELRALVDSLLGSGGKVINGQAQEVHPAWLKLNNAGPNGDNPDDDPVGPPANKMAAE